MIDKFGPVTAFGTAGAVAADAATGGAVLGLFTDNDGDGRDDATGYTSAEYKEMFPDAFFDDRFYGDNPYYQDSVFLASNQSPSQFQGIVAAQGGEIVGPGTPTSDSIPALLSDGEFVMNAAAVRGAGGGDRKQGAKKCTL